jgi:hypothetical protein
MSDALHSALRQLPTALAFAAVLLAGVLVAKVVATALPRVVRRFRPDGGGRSDLSSLAGRLGFWGVLLVAAEIAFGLWGPNAVSALLADVLRWLPRAFAAGVVVAVAVVVARTVKDVVAAALATLAYGRTLGNIASVTIIGLGVIAGLNQIGVAGTVTVPILITVLATAGGVVVVGVGGGLIRPMQERWAGWLDRAEQEAPVIVQQARAYGADRTATVDQATMPLPGTGYLGDDVAKTVVIGRDIPKQ